MRPKSGNAPGNVTGSWANTLHDQPLVIASAISFGFPIGVFSFAGAFADEPVVNILFPMTSAESPVRAQQVARDVYQHLVRNPKHRIVVVGCDAAEVNALRNAGLNSSIINANCMINEQVFRPLPNVTPEFDAVHNSRMAPDKRPGLAVAVENLSIITFRDAYAQSVADFHKALDDFLRRSHSACLVNELTESGTKPLSPVAVNDAYARARVGLCLSAVEGPNRTSMEYMMAGLPVVSTASKGGRDYFFNPEYCWVVPDNPREIAAAVSALAALNIPREYIRKNVLGLLERERRKLAKLVEDTSGLNGHATQIYDRLVEQIHGHEMGLFQWQDMPDYVAGLEARIATSQDWTVQNEPASGDVER
jgi:glycosyltransferase involved in cell wall biosynthesis